MVVTKYISICGIAIRLKRNMLKCNGITISILQAHVEGFDIGDILQLPHYSSLCSMPSEPTGVQGRRDPACENRGPFGRTEETQGTQNMS
jgi:hypothetical protein